MLSTKSKTGKLHAAELFIMKPMCCGNWVMKRFWMTRIIRADTHNLIFSYSSTDYICKKNFRVAIKNIIFDLGGVLLNLDFNRTYEALKKLGIDKPEEIIRLGEGQGHFTK